MSQNIESFIAAAAKPGPLQDALKKAGDAASNEQVAEIAKAHGFQVTAAELQAHAASQPLGDDALDNVAAAGFNPGNLSFARKNFNFRASNVPSIDIDPGAPIQGGWKPGS